MRMTRASRQSTRREPLGGSEAARGVAVVLAVVAVMGLLLGGMELLGFTLVLPREDGKPLLPEEAIGPLRMVLLAGALVLLGIWGDLMRPRGPLGERGVRRVANWVLVAAAALTAAGAGRVVYEGAKVVLSRPWT
jgi:hypothetical protein